MPRKIGVALLRRQELQFLEATVRAKEGTRLKGWTHVGVPREFKVPLPPQPIYSFGPRPRMPGAHQAPGGVAARKPFLRNP